MIFDSYKKNVLLFYDRIVPREAKVGTGTDEPRVTRLVRLEFTRGWSDGIYEWI